jgi:hypothetical protein
MFIFVQVSRTAGEIYHEIKGVNNVFIIFAELSQYFYAKKSKACKILLKREDAALDLLYPLTDVQISKPSSDKR